MAIISVKVENWTNPNAFAEYKGLSRDEFIEKIKNEASRGDGVSKYTGKKIESKMDAYYKQSGQDFIKSIQANKEEMTHILSQGAKRCIAFCEIRNQPFF